VSEDHGHTDDVPGDGTPRRRGPSRWATVLLVALVKGYRLSISPLIGPRCRHLPTCSSYALEAVEVHGPVRGSWLAVKRIVRCHPWGTSGYDPVPPARKRH